MKSKKYITTVIAILFLITVLGYTTEPAKASDMTCSEAIIEVIKEYEGFRSYVYWDGGKAYIGYGTSVNSGDYPNGISREGADTLMREVLAVKEEAINKMIDKYGLTLTQGQFDGLMDFTYNIGTGWMSSSNRIFRYLTEGIENYTDMEIVNAIGVWCHQGGEIVNRLYERRLRDASVFLYDDYDISAADNYCYIEYDAGKGEVEHSMIIYEYGEPYGQLQEAERDGYTLTGWVTDSGTSIDAYTVATDDLSVSAVWTEGIVTVPEPEPEPETEPEPEYVYTDVTEEDWFYGYIIELSDSGVFSGYDDGTFRPDDNVTYGQALKLVLRAVGFDVQNPTEEHWASGYLDIAEEKCLVDETVADLDDEIDRLTVAEITAKAIGLPPLEPETVFADTQDGFVLALYYCEIIAGSSNASGELMFYPDNSITRAELSSIIYKICNSGILPE